MNLLDGKSFGSLSRESILQGFKATALRTRLAPLGQVLVYAATLFSYPDLRSDWRFYFAWALLGLGALIRNYLTQNIDRLYARENGFNRWRYVYMCTSQVVAIVWGVTVAYVFIQSGLTPLSMMIIIGCFCSMAGFAASGGFDRISALLFIFIIAAGIGLGLAYAGIAPLFWGTACYAVFCVHMMFSQRRLEIQLFEHVEEVDRSHNLINSMISSINEVFLIVGLDGHCKMAASERSKELLGVDPLRMHLNDILRLQGPAAEESSEWFKTLISGNVDFALAAGLGPSTLDLEDGHKRLSLKFHAMRNPYGTLTGVAMTALDTTLEMLQQREIEAARERAELIVGLHDNPSTFRALLQDFERVIERLVEWSGEDLDQLRFDLHTLKGNATLAGAIPPGRLIHRLEQGIRENPGAPAEFVRKIGAEFARDYRAWLYAEQETFEKAGIVEDRTMRVSRDKLAKLKINWAKSPETQNLYARLEHDLFSTEFGELFEPFESQVRYAADASGKRARLVIERPEREVFIDPVDYREVFGPFVHLFTNAVDHGIETPAEREAKGKPPEGTITVRYHEGNGLIHIEVSDDGGGINLDKLRQKLTSQGVADAASLSDKQIVAHIFDEGLSTRDQVTSLSGMGMGLGALRAGVIRAAGSVEVKTTGPMGTTILIKLARLNVAMPSAA